MRLPRADPSQSGVGLSLFSHSPDQIEVFLRAVLHDCVCLSEHKYFLDFVETTTTVLFHFVLLTADLPFPIDTQSISKTSLK